MDVVAAMSRGCALIKQVIADLDDGKISLPTIIEWQADGADAWRECDNPRPMLTLLARADMTLAFKAAIEIARLTLPQLMEETRERMEKLLRVVGNGDKQREIVGAMTALDRLPGRYDQLLYAKMTARSLVYAHSDAYHLADVPRHAASFLMERRGSAHESFYMAKFANVIRSVSQCPEITV